MPYSINLPDGSTVDNIPDDLDPKEAARRIAVARPDLMQMTRPSAAKSGFMPAVAAGWENLKGDVAGLAGRTGLMSIADAEAQQARNRAASAAAFTPTKDTWLDSPWLKFKETLGGSVPYMAAPVVAGAAGAAAAPALPAVALGAAGLTSAAQFTGSNLSRQQAEGKKLADTDLAAAGAAAVPQALLDMVGFKMIPGIRRIFQAAGKELTPQAAAAIAKNGIKGVLADYAKAGVKASGAEGLTEAGQQVLERLQAGLALDDAAAREEYLQSFIGGAALGGALAVPGRFHERGREQMQIAELDAAKQAKAEADAAAIAQQQEQQKVQQRQDPAHAQKVTADYERLNAEHQAMLPGKLGAAATGADKLEHAAQTKAAAEFYEKNVKPLEAEAAAVRPTLRAMQDQAFRAAEEKARATKVEDSGEVYDGGQAVVDQLVADRDVAYQQQQAAVKMAQKAAAEGNMVAAKAAQQQAMEHGQRAKTIERQLAGRQNKAPEAQDQSQQIARLTKQYGVALQSGKATQAEALRVELEKLHAQQQAYLKPRQAPTAQTQQVESEETQGQVDPRITTPMQQPAAEDGKPAPWRPKSTPALDQQINARQAYLPKDPILPPNQRDLPRDTGTMEEKRKAALERRVAPTNIQRAPEPPAQRGEQGTLFDGVDQQLDGPEALRMQIGQLKMRPGMPANTQASLDRMDQLLQRDDLPRMAYEDIKEQVYRIANMGEGSAPNVTNQRQYADMLARKQEELNYLRANLKAMAGLPDQKPDELRAKIAAVTDEMGAIRRAARSAALGGPKQQVLTPRQEKQPVFIPQSPQDPQQSLLESGPEKPGKRPDTSGLTRAQRKQPVPTDDDIGRQANKEGQPHAPGYTKVGEVGYVPAEPRTQQVQPAPIAPAPMSPAAAAEAEEGSGLDTTSAPIERPSREEVAPADPNAIGTYTPVQRKRRDRYDQGDPLTLEGDIERRMAKLSPKDQETIDFWDEEYGVDSPVGKAVRDVEGVLAEAEAALEMARTNRAALAQALFQQKQAEEAKNQSLRQNEPRMIPNPAKKKSAGTPLERMREFVNAQDEPDMIPNPKFGLRDVATKMTPLGPTEADVVEAQRLVERRQAELQRNQAAVEAAREKLEDALQGAALFDPGQSVGDVEARVDAAVSELLPMLQHAFPVASTDVASAEAVRDAFADIVTRSDLSHKDALAYLDNRRLFTKGFGDAFGPQIRGLFETIVRLKAFTGVARRLREAQGEFDAAQRTLPAAEQRVAEAQRESAQTAAKVEARRGQETGAALETPRGKTAERTAAEQRLADAENEVKAAQEARDVAAKRMEATRTTRKDVMETVDALRRGDAAPLVQSAQALQDQVASLSAELDKVRQSMENVQSTVDADTAALLQDPAAWDVLQARFDFLADVAAETPLSPLVQTRAIGLVESSRRADELSTRAELKHMRGELERLRKTYAQAQLENDKKAEKYAKDEFDALVKKMQTLRDDQELRGMEGGTEAGDVNNSPAMTHAQAVADHFVSVRQDLLAQVNALRERIAAVNALRSAAKPETLPPFIGDKTANPYAGVSAGLDSMAEQLVQKPPALSSRMTNPEDRTIEQRENERNASPEMQEFIARIEGTEKRGPLNKERGALVVERDNWIEKADTANIVSTSGRVLLPVRAALGASPWGRQARIATKRNLIAEKARIVQAKIDIIDARLDEILKNPRVSAAEQARTEAQAAKQRAQPQRRAQGQIVRNAQTPSSYLRSGSMENRVERQGGTRDKLRETSTVAQPTVKQAVAAGNEAAAERGVQQVDAAKQKADLAKIKQQKLVDLKKQLDNTRKLLAEAEEAKNKGTQTYTDYVRQLRETETGLVRDLAVAQRNVAPVPFNKKTASKPARKKPDVPTLEVDEDDGGTPVLFRTTTNTGTGMTTGAVTAAVNKTTEGWTNTPEVQVVAAEAELPQHIQDQAARDSMTGKIPGLFDPDTGVVYLVAENLHNDKDVALTVVHEMAGHYGLRDMMGADYAPTMNRLYNGNDKIKAAADARMEASPNLTREVAVEEVLAEMSETLPARSQLTKELVRAYYAIKSWLAKKLGIKNVSDGEVRQIVANARRHVKRGSPKGDGPKGGQVVYRTSPYAIGNAIAKDKTFKERYADNLALSAEMWGVDMRAPLRQVLDKGDSKLGRQALYMVLKNDARMDQVNAVFAHGALGLRKDAKGNHIVDAGNSKSVNDVFKAIQKIPGASTEEKMEKAQVYLTAIRAQADPTAEFALQLGKLTPEQIAADLAKLTADPKQKAALEEVRRVYADLNRGLIKFLEETGALSKAQSALYMKSDSYVPFYRVRKDGVAELVFDETKIVRLGDIRTQPYLKQLEGGDEKLMPLAQSITRNVMLLTDMGMRNLTTRNVAYALQAIGKPAGKMAIHKGEGPANVRALRFKQDGEEYHSVVDTEGTVAEGIPSEMVARSVEGSFTVLPSFLKAFGWFGDVLRAGVTRNPMYVGRQLFRDPLAASFTGGLERGPITAIAKAMADFTHQSATGPSKTGETLLRKGIVNSGIFTGDPDDLSKMSMQLAGNDTGAIRKILNMADRAAMRADAVTRQQVYDDALRRTGSELEAEIAAREMMNFHKRGMAPTIQYASRMIPFFNAQIQGLNVLYKAATGKATMQEKLAIKQKFYDRAGLLMASTFLYALAMEDDDTYKNARASMRYGHWFIPLHRDDTDPSKDVTIKLPIPFEIGLIFKAVPEALIDHMRGQSTEQEWQAIRNMFLNQIPGGSSYMIPQAVKPLIEVATNHSFFMGREIEGPGMQGVDPMERYTARTTELAKRMSEMLQSDVTPDFLKLSPVQIEHLARGYLGTLPIIGAAMVNEMFGTATKETPERKLAETPLFGPLFQDRFGGGATDILYAKIKAANQVQATVKKMENEGRKQDAKMYLQNVENLGAIPQLQNAEKRLQELSKKERAVRASESATPERKREILNQLALQRERISRRYLDAVSAVAQ